MDFSKKRKLWKCYAKFYLRKNIFISFECKRTNSKIQKHMRTFNNLPINTKKNYLFLNRLCQYIVKFKIR